MNSTIELIFNNGKKASKITKINPYDNPQPWKYPNTQVKQPFCGKNQYKQETHMMYNSENHNNPQPLNYPNT